MVSRPGDEHAVSSRNLSPGCFNAHLKRSKKKEEAKFCYCGSPVDKKKAKQRKIVREVIIPALFEYEVERESCFP